MTERKNRTTKPVAESEPPDLDKERDAFIQTFFKKGWQLTEELIRENQRLRTMLAETETENLALRAQVRSDEAIRELLHKIQNMEAEKRDMVSRFRDAEARSDEYAATFAEVEAELANLASLYVASNQLHSTLNLRGVVRQIKEMLAQLVGARSFAIYFVSDDGTTLVPIAVEGVRDPIGSVPVGDGPTGEAFVTRNSSVAEDGDVSKGSVASPVACVPLRVEDRVVGVITIFATYEQKQKFLPVDYEFFKLLAAHAASAIIAARLFAEAQGKTPGIDSFLELGV